MYIMYCFECFENADIKTPLLLCGCFVCSKCYVKCKQNKIYTCSCCNKKLIRGKKKWNTNKNEIDFT